jgi:hypothetical protein
VVTEWFIYCQWRFLIVLLISEQRSKNRRRKRGSFFAQLLVSAPQTYYCHYAPLVVYYYCSYLLGYKPVRDALQHRLPNRQPSAAFSTSAVTKNVDTSKPSKDFDQSSKTGSNNLAEKMKQAPTVGIVGGGVAGLQTARALMAKGFEVTVFESAAAVGGVWRENYLNFGIQVPKEVIVEVKC